MSYYYHYNMDFPFGSITVTADDDSILSVFFSESEMPAGRNSEYNQYAETSLIREAAVWLDSYFKGKNPPPEAIPPIHMSGSPFRREVLNMVREIPYGLVTSYGDIAAEITSKRGIPKMSAQAVGGAVKSNELLILIPCHRVIGAKGAIGGYGGRTDIKRWLLNLEREHP